MTGAGHYLPGGLSDRKKGDCWFQTCWFISKGFLSGISAKKAEAGVWLSWGQDSGCNARSYSILCELQVSAHFWSASGVS